MSFQAMAWAVKQTVGDDQAKHLLLTLANFANDEGKAWPSITRLSKDTEMSRRTIFRKLDVLVEKGLIHREPKETPAGTYSVYTLKGWCQADTSSVTEALGGVTLTRGGGVRLTPKPIEEEPIKEPVTGKNITPREALVRVLSEEMADALIEHRKGMKASLTTTAAKLLAKQFEKHTDPDACVSMMLERGWKGFDISWMTPGAKQGRTDARADRNNQWLDALAGREQQADFIDGDYEVVGVPDGQRMASGRNR